MKVAITNLGTIVSGDWRAPFVKGDTVITQDGRIATVGTASAAEVEACDVEIDAGGMTAIPGLIDSHVHITFGDYTPRQRTVGYLESYLHGGVTTSISASEVHVPGRPRDPEGRESAGIGGAALLCGLSSRRHARDRGLGHSRAGTKGRGFHRARSQRRRPGQGRLRRGEDRLRLRAAGRCRQGGRHDHHLPHRRLVHPRLRRDHRRSSVEDASARLVSHQRRTDRDAGSRTSSA